MSGPKINMNQPEFPRQPEKPVFQRREQQQSSSQRTPDKQDKFKKMVEKEEEPETEKANEKGEGEVETEGKESLFEALFSRKEKKKEAGEGKARPFVKEGKGEEEVPSEFVPDKPVKGGEQKQVRGKETPVQFEPQDEMVEAEADVETESESETESEKETVGPATTGLHAKDGALEGVGAVKRESSEVKSGATGRAEVWSLVEKLVEKITELKSTGKTEITITLKEPPLFQGAQIRIEEFSHAKNEFNIAFENLTPRAQELLEANRNSLKKALEERGYALHIMTTNLETEKAARPEEGRRDQQGQREGGEGRGGRQGRDKEEEERRGR